MVKNPPAKQEIQIQPLGGEDSLEEEMATHSSILSWRIPQTKEPSGRPRGHKKVGQDLGSKQPTTKQLSHCDEGEHIMGTLGASQ